MNNQMNNLHIDMETKILEAVQQAQAIDLSWVSPMSTMAPTMVFNEEGDLILITGSPGGSLIPAAILSHYRCN